MEVILLMKKLLWLVSLSTSYFVLTSIAALGQQADVELQIKINKGFVLAPVPLNLVGRDSNLVGYGSYIVNAVGECNGCHSAGNPTAFAPGGNPYFGQFARPNPATYLGGGNDFGAFPDPAGPFPHIVSRNLTPDKTGRPVGGDTLQDFMQTMRTGLDPDKLHPPCLGKPDGKCIPAPFNGTLLMVMPWPAYANMTDRDLQAIYEYLAAIPCLEDNPITTPNRCGPVPPPVTGVVTAAVAGPKGLTVQSRQFQLDGTKSISGPGGVLTYLWTIPYGSPSASMLGATTATPTVQLGQRGTYTFQLTVTDSKGVSATDTVSVNFQGN